MTVRLTALSHGAGCGCKLGAAELAEVLEGLPGDLPPEVLVGPATADDAGVYRLRDDLALVQTADFFTPIVDDPYDFGRIAAANALSDVYAMGARPVTALNLVAFSLEELGPEVLREILRGGADVAREAGAAIVGGHSIEDREPKYGLAVTGVVHPGELLTNAGGRPGDALVLTKPLGAGAIATAAKRDRIGTGAATATKRGQIGTGAATAAKRDRIGTGAATAAGSQTAAVDPLASAVAVMVKLNAAASAAALAAGAHAATDVTGFGLLGHLHELASASGVAAELSATAVPSIPGAVELLAGQGAVSGGLRRNASHASSFATFDPAVSDELRRLVSDPMTSGGLLIALDPDRAGEVPGPLIGRLRDGVPGEIAVLP